MNHRGQRKIANFGEARTVADTDNTGRMGSAGNEEHPSPALSQLLVHANDRSRPSADRRVVAELLARDEVRQLAMIKIDAKGLPTPTWLDDPSQIRVGQWAIALGRGLGGVEPSKG